MPSFTNIEALCSAQGRDLGYGDWIVVSQDRIDRFTESIEYHESMHVDLDRAASDPLAGNLAPGLLTLSLVSRLCTGLIDLRERHMTINYGLNRVRFRAPLAAGARIRARGRLTSVTRIDRGVQIVLDIAVEHECGTEPVCVAQTVRRYYV